MATKEAHPTNTSTEHVAPGEHGGGFPPFQKDTFASQLVWLVIAFVALYLLISRIAVPRIGGIFEERAKRIADDLGAAQGAKAESEAAIAAYEKALAEARNRAQAIAGETRDALNAEAEAQRKSLEGELNGKLADAEKQIAATKANAMANVRGIAVDTAGAIVERLIGTAPAPAAVAAAVDEALKR
jgi:F-type H+-transporting ATPase subunit b